jgi:hypothetical protein
VLIGFFAEAANESLTVDDKFLVGILIDKKTYLLGDRDIVPAYAPAQLIQNWGIVATKFFEPIRDALKTINGEATEAQRVFSKIRDGSLTPADGAPILAANASIRSNLQNLSSLVTGYRAWYDGLLGRT